MVIKQNNNKVKFEKLKVGDVFRCGDIVYIRTNYITTDGGCDYDAYDLLNDDFCNFFDYNIVEKVEAELIIK